MEWSGGRSGAAASSSIARNLVEKLAAQPYQALFVPVASGSQIGFGARAYDHSHQALRNRASVSDQGEPACGLAS